MAQPPKPSDQLEEMLAGVWAEVLGLDRVGRDDDFFALGGDSLAAAIAFDEIAERLACPLPAQAVLEARTVGALAELIVRRAAPTSAVVVRRGGGRPPLFTVLDGRGDIFYSERVAGLLPPDQPVYAIGASDAAVAAFSKAESFSTACRHYQETITQIRPQGPYQLYGYSLGGLVAFEVALQLQAGGAKVSLLVIGDVPAPGAVGLPWTRWRSLVTWPKVSATVARLGRIRRTRGYRSVGHAFSVSIHESLEVVRWRFGTSERHRRRSEAEEYRRLAKTDYFSAARSLVTLAQGYAPVRRFSGDVLFLRTDDRLRAFPSHASQQPDRGWWPYVEGTVETVHIPCLHHQLHEQPFISTVGDVIGMRLASTC